MEITTPPKEHDREVYEDTQAAGLARKMGLFVPKRLVADYTITLEDGLRVCVIGEANGWGCELERVWLDSDPGCTGILHLLNDDALKTIENACVKAFIDPANKADFMEDM